MTETMDMSNSMGKWWTYSLESTSFHMVGEKLEKKICLNKWNLEQLFSKKIAERVFLLFNKQNDQKFRSHNMGWGGTPG